ncbi:MAG: DUF5916 domain-containing protein [Acidobacteriota bacterium]
MGRELRAAVRLALTLLLGFFLSLVPATTSWAVPQLRQARSSNGQDAGKQPQDPATTAATVAEQKGSPGGKRMTALRIEEDLTIDGLLREPAWQQAEAISDFLQREPNEGEPASERTEVRILYNDRFLYVGFILYDSEPDQIIATDRRRDSRMRTDDTIAIELDTFHDHQNAFVFRVNPLGTKMDELLKNESNVNTEWDEEWLGAARITEEGWEAEMALPWKILRYPTGSHIWGVDFRREIRRKNEDVYWSNYTQDFRFNEVSQAGHLTGLDDLRLTDRYRLKSFLTTGLLDRNITDEPATNDLSDLGVEDLKLQVRPGLVLDFTANTDFAQVEVDQAQVNLTRFSLFFPEQREFFLEGRENFSFGTPQGRRGFGAPLALLFFSRRIGLRDGEPTPLDVAAKLTGKVGRTRVGVLNAQTGDTEDTAADNFTVVRIQQEIFSRSRVGMLLTNRSGGGTTNRVVGADGNFTFYKHLSLNGFLARATDTDLEGSKWAGQGIVSWNSDQWNFSGDILRVAPDFQTDLGFVLRKDIVRQSYRIGWNPRPQAAWLRQIRISSNFTQFSDTHGSLQSQDRGLFVNFNLESGDSFFVDFGDRFERLIEPFKIHKDELSPDQNVVIPVGDYGFQEIRAGFNLFTGRAVAGRFSVRQGGFFDGNRTTVSLSPSLRVGQSIQTSASYAYNQIDLREGSFTTHLVNGRLSYSFNERWLTDTLIQYSNTSDMLTVFARLDYIYRPNDDLFVVYQQTSALGGLFDGQKDKQFVVKLTHSLQF